MVGLAPLSATAGPTLGLQTPSDADGGLTQVQYYEPDPPAAVPDDDDDGELQDNAASRCAAQFRSFEPDTGYYTTYDGDRVLCPYLQ